MGNNPKYVIDTCSLTSLRRLYPYDLFAPVWEFVGGLSSSGLLCSVDEVYEELRAQDDEVLDWADQHSAMFFSLDEQIQEKAKEILKTHTGLFDYKKRTSSADPFLIALAVLLGTSVVTEEKGGSARRPKIPDVCTDYEIECIPLLEMLRREGFKLRS